MPNWCEGTLKVRGELNNLKRFVEEALNPVSLLGEDVPEEKKLVSCDESHFHYRCNRSLYVKNTRRNFVESEDIEVYGDVDAELIMLLEFKAAWGIDPLPLASLSKEYGVDIRITGFERGMEFQQEIEIIAGEITRNEEVKYTSWDWECPCPNIGG